MKKTLIVLWLAAGAGLPGCRQETSVAETQKALYHCPMHPTYTSDRMGACPICHMDLVLVESGPPSDTAPMSDRAAVFVAGEKEQWIGVRTAVLENRVLEKVIRASARVTLDADLSALLAEHNEFRAARDRAAQSGQEAALQRAESLVAASERRLAQRGVTPRSIGRFSDAGADPARRVYAQVYEDEARGIVAGQTVELRSPSALTPLRGVVQAVDRAVDPMTRTLRVRVSVPQQGASLPLESYWEAAIHVPLGTRLAVPKEAVIDTGGRQLVYVKTQPGHYAPRVVELGVETDDYYEVVKGLVSGDEVAVSGQFLIDSESRLKAVVSHGH
jgi:Cu(I)/Ag(I) efflux system membrane fusion protein